MTYKFKLFTASFFLIFVLFFALIGPYPQPLSYHDYADKRIYFNIPYFLNVISNLAFLVVGMYGLLSYRNNNLQQTFSKNANLFYQLFFIGIIITAFGSAYYHYQPNNDSLVWDRLPLVFALMSAIGGLICERTHYRYRFSVSLALTIFGLFSVIFWIWSEHFAVGDLRLYAIAQALAIIVAIYVLFAFRKPLYRDKFLMIALVCLGAARAFELTDKPIYYLLHETLSGHTLKHLFAAIAVLAISSYLITNKKTKIIVMSRFAF